MTAVKLCISYNYRKDWMLLNTFNVEADLGPSRDLQDLLEGAEPTRETNEPTGTFGHLHLPFMHRLDHDLRSFNKRALTIVWLDVQFRPKYLSISIHLTIDYSDSQILFLSHPTEHADRARHLI